MALLDFNTPFTIETDASGDGIGIVLSQNGQPIAYMSRALGVSKQAWSTYAKEMLAIIVAVKLWRPYLLGHKFYIQIDKRSLKYLLEQRFSTPKQHKWVFKLFGYDYEIVYKPGKENRPSMHFLGGMPTQPSMPSPYHKLSYGMISTNPYMQKGG